MNSKVQSGGFRRNFNILNYYNVLNFLRYFVQALGTIIDIKARPEFFLFSKIHSWSAGPMDFTLVDNIVFKC